MDDFQDTQPADKKRPRFRVVFMLGGSLLVLAALLLTDPDRGISTAMLLLSLVTPVLAVAFAHVARRALFDYLDLSRFAEMAGKTPTGAGLVFLGVCVVIAALLGLFGKSAHAAGPVADVPPHPRAVALAPVLRAEVARWWPELDRPQYVPALISHESCISYTHSRCWSPTSELRSQREQGLGLGQLTRAWTPTGELRFDTLAELRDRHPALRELDWRTLATRPDLQIRALVIQSRGNWQALAAVPDPEQRLAMTDAAYNGGLGGVQRERRACQIAEGCDPARWFGHVERHCLKSRKPLYGGRSACDINRHHVRDVWARMPRYRGIMS